MSTLAKRSVLVLGSLFALLFAVGTAVLWHFQMPLSWALGFACAMVGLQFLIGPWLIDRVFKIRWISLDDVSPEYGAWIREVCAARNIPVPKYGIIEDGNPNAFTYGHFPRDARVVVTSGLLEILDYDEAKAVVAHELGHIDHWDFVVMSIAQVVPLLLYYMYVWTRNNRSTFGHYTYAVSFGAYVAYIVSQYVVLMLSRVREFFADEHSAMLTEEPNALASALVKIGYGLANQPLETAAAKGDKKKKKSQYSPASAVAALGISSAASSRSFAITATGPDGGFSTAAMARAMQWDLRNPWGQVYQLGCTHPLTALRIEALGRVAKRLGQEPLYDVAAIREEAPPYTGLFSWELFVFALPVLAAAAGAVSGVAIRGERALTSGALALAGLGLGWLIKMALVYPRIMDEGEVRTVESLVADEMQVSGVHPVRCSVEGEIIGRGIPGLIWSADLVVRDETGFIFAQYRQPLRIMNAIFGLVATEAYIGKRVRIVGWYRRAPGPYVEVQRIEVVDEPSMTTRCCYPASAAAFAAFLFVIGLLGAGITWFF